MGRTQFDWEAIKAEYRTGQWSDKELARRHGFADHGREANPGPSPQAIGKKARKENWPRDLSRDVRGRTQQLMLHGDGEQVSREDAVDRAARERVEIQRKHRANYAALRASAEALVGMVAKRAAWLSQLPTISANAAQDLADLIATTEKALTRMQDAERLAFDLMPVEADEDDGDSYTDEGRAAALFAILQRVGAGGDHPDPEGERSAESARVREPDVSV